jgi:hypothetical protein
LQSIPHPRSYSFLLHLSYQHNSWLHVWLSRRYIYIWWFLLHLFPWRRFNTAAVALSHWSLLSAIPYPLSLFAIFTLAAISGIPTSRQVMKVYKPFTWKETFLKHKYIFYSCYLQNQAAGDKTRIDKNVCFTQNSVKDIKSRWMRGASPCNKHWSEKKCSTICIPKSEKREHLGTDLHRRQY